MDWLAVGMRSVSKSRLAGPYVQIITACHDKPHSAAGQPQQYSVGWIHSPAAPKKVLPFFFKSITVKWS
jgi:hypothetical protein